MPSTISVYGQLTGLLYFHINDSTTKNANPQTSRHSLNKTEKYLLRQFDLLQIV